jgi:YidC/Oxa1 family membrane protein insertase
MNLDQEKRVMIAFALSLVMLMLYRVYFVKEQPPEQSKPAAAAKASPGQPEPPKTTAPTSPPARVTPPAAALPVVQGSKSEEIVVESKLYRVTFSTVGADVRSWELKNYPKGEEIDIIDSNACAVLGFPLNLDLDNSALTSQVNQAIYEAKAYGGEVIPSGSPSGSEPAELSGNTFSPPVTLSFTYSDGRIRVTKRFSFAEDYSVKAEVRVFDGQRNLPVQVAWPGGFGDQTLPPALEAAIQKGAYESLDETKVHEVTLAPSFLSRFFSGGSGSNINDLKQIVPGPLVFAGLEDRYFAGMFLTNSPDISAQISREVWTPPDWKGEEKDKPKALGVRIGNAGGKPLDFRVYVAPKDLGVLRAANPPLDGLVDFGFFSVVAKPLFICMRYIHDHWVHNYGWAIVLLTIIITGAMFPLRLKGLRSAQDMQKAQPIIKGIQDKYKQYKFNDPRKQKMQEEIMEVYKKYGINPFGSCLPMLLQLPVLYAFYAVLGVSIELRHAPWILWVKDLSAPDCLNVAGHCVPVLVILMTVVSYLLQRMTPIATVDPSQQRMMALMPLMYLFFFYKLASGMTLYWLVSSSMQAVQQVYINRKIPPANAPPVARKLVQAKG